MLIQLNFPFLHNFECKNFKNLQNISHFPENYAKQLLKTFRSFWLSTRESASETSEVDGILDRGRGELSGAEQRRDADGIAPALAALPVPTAVRVRGAVVRACAWIGDLVRGGWGKVWTLS